jgi:hypothetical protein
MTPTLPWETPVWSYSRLRTYEDCPYRWFLKYRLGLPEKQLFFASYGSFLHELLAQYFLGELPADELESAYLLGFRDHVPQYAPNATIFQRYFRDGLAYLHGFSPPPYNVLAVEQRVEFSVDGLSFLGFLDLVCERDGQLYILDHKSRALKPRSGRAKPTKTDLELDAYFRQLYLYAVAVQSVYGVLPTGLILNCFRVGRLIEEPFTEAGFLAAKTWACNRVAQIEFQTVFPPNAEFFKCRYLCEMQDHCEYCTLL